MKKTLALIIALSLILCLLGGCGASVDKGSGGRMRIVCTVFPAYDWVMNILGDESGDAEVTLLLDKGVDMHSYQPSAADIITISTCDLFVYVGGESDRWVADALKGAVNKDMAVIDLMETLGSDAKEEELVEGMQTGEEEHDEGPEYDEHVWLSLNNAALFCQSIAKSLSALDPENAGAYAGNDEAYISELVALDKEYRETVAGAKHRTLLFADRFPFRYMTEDYDIPYYAAFEGCSAETEASFETVMFLSGKADELGLKAILTIDGSDQSLARTVAENTAEGDQAILTMDSMQAVSSEKLAEGVSYLSIMESNLDVLKTAMN